MLDDIINQSIEELEEEEKEINKLPSTTGLILNGSFTETPIKELWRSKRIAGQKKKKKKKV